MDEVPYWTDGISNYTVDEKGKKTIDVKTTGSDKLRFTSIKCVRADGKILPTMIIFKGALLMFYGLFD